MQTTSLDQTVLNRNPSVSNEADSAHRGEAHRRVVRDQFVQLHDVFDRSRPSESIRTIFEQSVGEEIRRRLASGAKTVRILEVGCGVGNWAEYLYSTFSDCAGRIEYLGIDFAEPCVDSCNRRLAGRSHGRAMVADFEKYTVDTPFDIVIFVEVFCHLRRDQEDAWLARAVSCLSSGGVMVIIDKERFSRHGWKVRWDLFKRRVLPTALQGRLYYFPRDYNTLLTTLRYPSFAHLSGELKRLGVHTAPVIRHGLFTTIVAKR